MCGICSIVHLDQRPAASEVLAAMNSVALNRGPDGQGIMCVGAVGLGHTRLSIIDVDNRSAQPMSRNQGHLSYNGEIYNHIELRKELEAKGHSFSTNSDTEVLVVALQEWGKHALDRLCGMFAFVYYDEKAKEIWVVRDRFGIKPLVFSRIKNSILFASEAKQILKSGLVPSEIDIMSATAFLGHGLLNHSAKTFFSGIEEVRAGELITISLAGGEIKRSQWYNLSANIKPMNLSYDDALEALRERLNTSIIRHHRSDVPLASCLSGGIDSSVIVTLSNALFPDKHLTTISTFSPQKGYDETRFSRAVNAATGSHPIEVETETRQIWHPELLEKLCYIQDQPFLTGSHFNEFLVFEAARKNGFTVMLDGQGADEYFGGYGNFWFAAQCDLLRSGQLVAFMNGLRANAATMKRSLRSEIFMFSRNLMGMMRAKNKTGSALSLPWLRQALPSCPAQPVSFNALALEQIAQTSIPYQLHSEDRNSMYWSIESRVPFLDHELVECTMSLPTEYKVGRGFRKRILRDAVPELPSLIAKRKDKVGFASPDAFALKHQVKDVRNNLEKAAVSFPDLIESRQMLASFDQMIAGKMPYDPVFLRVLALDSWRKAHKVSV